MPTSLPPEILALPVSQRMELAAQIWDSIQPSEIELSEEYRRILDERLAKYEAVVLGLVHSSAPHEI
jgi:putative addiction module component (TIGR02574 family)